MKVHIDAGGREVTIECADANVSPREVASEALVLWKATATADEKGFEGPALGFVPQTAGRSNGPAAFVERPLHVTSEAPMNGGAV